MMHIPLYTLLLSLSLSSSSFPPDMSDIRGQYPHSDPTKNSKVNTKKTLCMVTAEATSELFGDMAIYWWGP